MIYLAVCTFAGHREVFSSSIEADIDCALEEIIQTDDDFIFYSGGMGEFDKKCESAVRRIKRTHPERSIRLVLVLPYLTHEIKHIYFRGHTDCFSYLEKIAAFKKE